VVSLAGCGFLPKLEGFGPPFWSPKMALVFNFKSIKERFDILGFEYICTRHGKGGKIPIRHFEAGTLPSVWKIHELMDDTNDLIGGKNA